jgi:hypothetical protein
MEERSAAIWPHKTFQDVVEIAQRLDLSYIWIDSLCIIQKFTNRLATEALQMSDVYKYSFSNISATAAADDTEGCLSPRDMDCIPDTLFQTHRRLSPRQSNLRIEFVISLSSSLLSCSGSMIRILT